MNKFTVSLVKLGYVFRLKRDSLTVYSTYPGLYQFGFKFVDISVFVLLHYSLKGKIYYLFANETVNIAETCINKDTNDHKPPPTATATSLASLFIYPVVMLKA